MLHSAFEEVSPWGARRAMARRAPVAPGTCPLRRGWWSCDLQQDPSGFH